MSGRVFISYARASADTARSVSGLLAAQGYAVWIDDQLLAHRPFADSIEEALTAADAAIVLWSDDAVKSDWVRSEANRARADRKLVQVTLDRCILPMPFDQIHCIDLAGWRGDADTAAWRSVLSSLAVVVGPRSRPVAAAASAPPANPSPPRAALERRRITVLAGVIANRQALVEDDPEEMLTIAEAFHARAAVAVADYGGTIVEHAPGRFLAFFGQVHASEEDGANAVRAALAVRDGNVDHPVSLGVATGLVVVTPGASGSAAVVGDTPAVAAALAEAAAPGAILVSTKTRQIAEGVFGFASAPSVARRDGGKPIPAYSVATATAAVSRSQARVAADGAHLVGRGVERDCLVACWAAARDGMGQVVLITGEAGIGKSMLLDGFRATLPPTVVALRLFCGPAFAASALYPVTQAVCRAAAIAQTDPPPMRRAKLDNFAAAIGVTDFSTIEQLAELIDAARAAAPGDRTPERRRGLMLDAIVSLFDAVARSGGLLIIEDLHWADPTTLELLDRAVDRVSDHGWMILGTARPEFSCTWAERADLAAIGLEPLNANSAREICHQIDPDQCLPNATTLAIIARGDGNPLFVEEMMRFALARVAEAGGDDSGIGIPNTLHDLLVERLDRLASGRDTVRAAATLGRQFNYDMIAAVTAATMPVAELRGALRELAKERLLTIVGTPPNSVYTFRHALFVDAVYESIPKRARELLHSRIATVLRDQFAEVAVSNPALLASHLTRSGEVAAAIPFWAQAGAVAAATAAYVEAFAAFRTALDLLRAGPRDAAGSAVELQLLLGLAASLSATLGYSADEVGATLAEARTIADRLDTVDSLFIVLRGLYAFTIVRGELDAAETLARRLLEIAERTGLPIHSIEATGALGYVRWTKGNIDEGRLLLERMAALYETHRGETLPGLWTLDPLVQGLGPLGLAYAALGDRAGVARVAAQLDAMIVRAPDGFSRTFAAYWRSTLVDNLADLSALTDAAEKGAAMAAEGGYVVLSALLAVSRGSLMGQVGDAASGLALAAPSLEVFERIGQRHGQPFVRGEVAWLYGLNGDVTAALRLIGEAIDLAEEINELYSLAPLWLRKASLLAQRGDYADARSACETARFVATQQGGVGLMPWVDAVAHDVAHAHA